MRVKKSERAAHIRLPPRRVDEFVRGKRGVTPESAWLLSVAPGTTPEFWINLQTHHDLDVTEPKRSVERLRATG